MCGICGLASSAAVGSPQQHTQIVRQMSQVLVHRGPDGHGVFATPGVGLGHRRLAIIDVEGGAQPMTSPCGNVTVSYNGEIYNYAELRKRLGSSCQFRTRSDTEVLLQLYIKYGPSCVEHLRGMFAFAVWDERTESLFLARDRFGIKPLYYAVHKGVLYFASEMKAMFAAGVPAELNPSALPDFLANRGTSDEQTLFKGVFRLAPGHHLTWTQGRIQIRSYWDLTFQVPSGSNGEAVHESGVVQNWLEAFRDAVRAHLVSDVPVGIFLSGGIDSSAIATVMAEEAGQRVKSFSVGFKEAEANELVYARRVADHIGADHYEVLVDADQFFSVLPHLIWHEDEPLASAASVPLYFVSQLAAKHVRVVLSGEGADELLAGYARYNKALLQIALGRPYYTLVPRAVRTRIAGVLDRMLPPGRSRQRARRTFLHVEPTIEAMYWDNFAVFPLALQEKLYAADFRTEISEITPYRSMQAFHSTAPTQSTLNRMLYTDVKTSLHELLMKQDQMSMAASVESRVPFLDHHLAGHTARLPIKYKLGCCGDTKRVLRSAMRRRLPPEILRRKKMGFPVPIGRWFRGRYSHVLRDHLLQASSRSRDLFDQRFVTDLIERHEAGEDHAERLWSLLNVEIWQRRFLAGAPLSAASAYAPHTQIYS